PYFLVVGTLEPRKNLLRLLDAFAQARRAGLPVDLVLAGKAGRSSEAILQRLQAADLRDHVRHVPAPDEDSLVQLYLQARALLFPSLLEGFGLPILEAMHCQVPVLTSDRSAMPE